ncbi:unnamed protein product [marine sediment metagenome]|uniref:Uncharacterized protein n=1 Tax=marine sediment metagenome TaxID=412755 RepID=X1ILY4_9ZZZZ
MDIFLLGHTPKEGLDLSLHRYPSQASFAQHLGPPKAGSGA